MQAARALAASAFSAAGITEAQDDAMILLCHAAGIRRIDVLNNPAQVLAPAQRITFAACVTRRLAREPVTRITGNRGFWNTELHVAPDVLDPRSDTETLIAAALQLADGPKTKPRRILDLGCGSGAIVCALLQEWPNANAVAIDLSPAACALTQENAAACGVATRLSVECRGWGPDILGPFDFVLSNPPYIRSADIAELDPEVRLWDPVLALDGGADGLDAYREIAASARGFLNVNGWLVLEVGYDQSDDVQAILIKAGWDKLSTFKDLSGHIRAVAAAFDKAR